MTNYSADRSERARQLVAEGRIGGRREGSGRPRKPRPSEMAAEAAHRHWEAIEAALVAGVEHGSPEQRSRSADRWLRVALGDASVDLRQRAEERADDAYARLSDDEVRVMMAQVLADALCSGELSTADLAEVVDAEVVDAAE